MINAEPSQFFYWLDDAERVMKWVPNIVENEDLQVTEDKVGSTFRQVYLEHGRRMEMQGVVTEYESDRRLGCEINGDAFDLVLDYQLEDLGGSTRLPQNSTVRFKGVIGKLMGFLVIPFVKRSSQKQLTDSFAKLKELAESGVEA